MKLFNETTYDQLYPLAPTYNYADGVDINSRVITHEDGYSEVISPLFNRVKDISINRKTLLLLTSAVQLNQILDIPSTTLTVDVLLLKGGLKTTDDSWQNFVRVDTGTNLLYADSGIMRNSTFFMFRSVSFPRALDIDGGCMQIYVSRPDEWSATGCITVSRTWPYTLSVQDWDPNDFWWQQIFDYSVTGTHIRLRSRVRSQYQGTIQAYVSYDPADNHKLKLMGDATHSYDFTVESPDNTQQFNQTNFSGVSYWIKYHNDIVDQQKNRSVEINTDTSIKNIPVNILCSSAYETAQIQQNSVGAIPYNFNVLKNFQTPEYEYTDNKFYVARYRVRGNVKVHNNQFPKGPGTGGPGGPGGTGGPPILPHAPLVPGAGIVMRGFPTTVVTDVDGNYSVLVNNDFTGIIYPDEPTFTFSPSGASLSALDVDLQQDFVGTLSVPVISGVVLDSGANPLSGVNIITSSDLPTATTDAHGAYVIYVPYNWNGTMSLSASYVATFNPFNPVLINIQDTTTQNFIKS